MITQRLKGEESCVLDVDVVQALLVEQQESLSAYAVSHNVHLLTNAERASAEILQKKKFNQQIQQAHEEQQQAQRFGMEQTQAQLSQADIDESDYQRQFDLVKAYLWEEFTREDFDNEGWLGVYVYMYVCM
jgi:DhnA family fructose-bisphosphate aldolase class Ia